MEMAKSKARKQREHDERNGKLNPVIRRGERPAFSLHERKTLTKQGREIKQNTKHKKRSLHGYGEEGTAFLFVCKKMEVTDCHPVARSSFATSFRFPLK